MRWRNTYPIPSLLHTSALAIVKAVLQIWPWAQERFYHGNRRHSWEWIRAWALARPCLFLLQCAQEFWASHAAIDRNWGAGKSWGVKVGAIAKVLPPWPLSKIRLAFQHQHDSSRQIISFELVVVYTLKLPKSLEIIWWRVVFSDLGRC